MREKPFEWNDAAPEGVLAPFEGLDEPNAAELSLLGMPVAGAQTDARLSRLTEATPAVLDCLSTIETALIDAAAGRARRRRVDHLTGAEQAVLFDALGSGEVAVIIEPGAADEGTVQISETVLPGVWVGRATDEAGEIAAVWVEVADAPEAMRRLAVTRPRADIAMDVLTPPRGAMNVMSVLAEIRSRAAAWRPGEVNHIMNFTLFPMTEVDTAFLAKVLGEAGVRASSGGYGAARVVMTALRNVWAVQYLNGMGKTILDTIEIGDVPQALLASSEDFEDSLSRLREIRGAYVA